MPNEEHRQHINLSTHANAIIAMDIAAFEHNGTVSGFINRVLECFCEDAEATIPNAVERYRTSLANDLKRSKYRVHHSDDEMLDEFIEDRTELTRSEQSMLDRLAEEYRRKTIERMNSFPRGVPLKIRLRNNVFETIYVDEVVKCGPMRDREDPGADEAPENMSCYRCQGDYIKAVVEEYARKPFFEREKIIYKERLEDLDRWAKLPPKERCILKVSMPRKGKAKRHVLDLKLYGVMTDASSNYHYIVGYTRDHNHLEDGFKPGCFRLGRAESIKSLSRSAGSGRITEKERKALEERIKEHGIEYLLSEKGTQKVLLSPRGLINYSKIMDMRPPYIEREDLEGGGTVLTFSCTSFQLLNYFVRFGEDAVIVDPPELAAEMLERHRRAFAAYNREG